MFEIKRCHFGGKRMQRRDQCLLMYYVLFKAQDGRRSLRHLGSHADYLARRAVSTAAPVELCVYVFEHVLYMYTTCKCK